MNVSDLKKIRAATGMALRECKAAFEKYGSADAAVEALKRPEDRDAYEEVHDTARKYARALRAIKARINSVWDDPDLMSFGELHHEHYDIERIIDIALKG